MHKCLELLIKNVEFLLRQKDLSKADLAKMTGNSPQAISRFLGGEHIPGIDKIERVAAALSVPTFYILMSPEDRKKWDNLTAPSRPVSQISPQEQLAVAASLLSDQSATNLLYLARENLNRTPSQRETEARRLLGQVHSKKKVR
jgi:transcriptional regulator with XRE-family HTH domain